MRPAPALLVAFALLACAPAPAPPPAAPTPIAAPRPPDANPTLALAPMVDRFVSAFGARWGEAYAVSGYLTVARDGQVLFARAYGKANRAKNRSADADTRFQIGSLTKQFTATAIAQLAERKLLRFEDPIRKYLPDYPRVGDTITIQQLLTHTSGIPEYEADDALMKSRGRPHSRAEVLASFQHKPLDFKPGERFSYSNSGYVVLGLILEKVSGQRYEDYLREHLLGPAGMRRTSTLDAPDDADTAVGYVADAGEALVPAPSFDASISFAAGALRSTAQDLILWDRALAGVTLLGEAARQRMFTPDKGDYACGWNVSHEAGRVVLWHEGRVDGFTSYLGRVPEERLVVIALLNNEGLEPAKIALPVLRMALTGQPVEPLQERAYSTLDSTAIGALAGDYRLSAASRREAEAKFPIGLVEQVVRLSIIVQEQRLYLTPIGQPAAQLFWGANDVLFTKRDDLEIVPEGGLSGASSTERFTLRQAGFSGVYERAPARP
jgi:CubicO group peptidase (beta-lactamase class C family)